MQYPDKRFDWESMRVFLAVARTGSVRSAAKKLGVGHSTISRRISGLEADLGVRLFEKVPGGLALTEVGERVLGHAERVEAEMFDLERQVMGRDTAPAGRVRLTLPPPMAYGPLMTDLVRFADAYPEIDVEIVVTYAVSDLTRRDADIAVRFLDEPEGWLVGRRLPIFRDAIYATPDYISMHTLDGVNPTARYIGWTGDEDHPAWVRGMPHPDCPIRWRIGDVTAQAAAARAGLGMCLLPCWVGDLDDALVRVPPGNTVYERQAWVLTHPDLRTTERVRLFVRYLLQCFEQHRPTLQGERVVDA
ncbi:MAG: LysR family transcriptional regulator [Pseudomonadota bacterium]